jgi:xanthine dehydrogenase/oxidase
VPARQAEIERFNAVSRWKKRGLAMVPTVRHVSLGRVMDNQGAAVVNVFVDGTVVVHTGGIEMGQGLFTKIAQVVAHTLGCDLSTVRVAETSTAVIPNATATVGSCGADLNAGAAKDACMILQSRFEPLRAELGADASLVELAKAAFARRIPLSASGFHRSDVESGFDWSTGQGSSLADYFALGVACVEVTLDCLTGEHTIERADLIVDAGQSINPALDIGQAEGAFVQGLGYHVLEEVQADANDSGRVISTDTSTYRIPAMRDVPRVICTTLLENSYNSKPRAVYSSKGVGEVATFLGSACYFALHNAVRAAREAQPGIKEPGVFQMASPATPDRVRMAIGDATAVLAAGGIPPHRVLV